MRQCADCVCVCVCACACACVCVCCSQDPDEALVELGVGGLQVTQLDGLAKQLLVEGQRKASVDVVAVENCQAHHAPHKVEVGQVVLEQQRNARQTETDRD